MTALLAILGAIATALGAFFFGRRVERNTTTSARAKTLEESSRDEAEAERRDEERELELRLGIRRVQQETKRDVEKDAPTTADVERLRARIAERRSRS